MSTKAVNGDSREESEGPTILKSELRHAIAIDKNGKAVRPEKIPMELIKLINKDKLETILRLFNEIYSTGETPEKWLISTFVTIPKKQCPKKCADYRLLSLMRYMLKTFFRIIHARIRSMCEWHLDDSQFGFRNAFGTREAPFGLNILLQKCRDHQKNVFACFIDYEKTFDRVLHSTLIDLLRQQKWMEKIFG